MDNTSRSKLRVVYGDATLGVQGEKLSVIFSYARGGMESLVTEDVEWIYRTPTPSFWRATTDNDRGNGFSNRSAMWYGADLFSKVVKVEVEIDEKKILLPIAPENNRYCDYEYAERIRISYTYETPTVPSTNVVIVHEIITPGIIKVTVRYHGNAGLPQLPVFGMRFLMPSKADWFEYRGLSGETYPDRMAGGVEGVYHIEGMPVTPYLVPQDCGVHMETEWIRVRRKGKELLISATDKKFAFSCLPYTAQQLEQAMHQEELPAPRRTVLSILGAVRGVGGIDSWGADVEEKYHISGEKDVYFSFFIEG